MLTLCADTHRALHEVLWSYITGLTHQGEGQRTRDQAARGSALFLVHSKQQRNPPHQVTWKVWRSMLGGKNHQEITLASQWSQGPSHKPWALRDTPSTHLFGEQDFNFASEQAGEDEKKRQSLSPLLHALGPLKSLVWVSRQQLLQLTPAQFKHCRLRRGKLQPALQF